MLRALASSLRLAKRPIELAVRRGVAVSLYRTRGAQTTSATKLRVSLPQPRFLNTAAPAAGGFSYPAPRSLDAVVNMELFAKESPESITKIWTEFHAASTSSMASVVSREDYKKMSQRGVATPFFVIPVQRGEGFFSLLAQYQGNSWLLTYLEDFKRDPSTAQPYLCITAYTELELSKGLVLLRADVCALATLNKEDAAKILAQISTFYADDAHYKYVFSFNKTPREFNFDEAHKAANAITKYESSPSLANN